MQNAGHVCILFLYACLTCGYIGKEGLREVAQDSGKRDWLRRQEVEDGWEGG